MEDVLKQPLIRRLVLPVLRWIERKTFSHASHINLISGGFQDYFAKYPQPTYSNFPNGIDDDFLRLPSSTQTTKPVRTITYAGNIGEGQGLHKIVPQAALRLGPEYRFLIIGDGGAKKKLESELNQMEVSNVELHPPVSRKELVKIYADSDYLFIHLNNYKAFKRVLPSKVFELGAYDKPIIAGVGGFAFQFIKHYLSNTILFAPGDVDHLVRQLQDYQYKNEFREQFITEFKRSSVNEKMARSIQSYLP